MRRILLWIKKPGDGVIIDKRSLSACSIWITAISASVCFWAAIAMAATGNTGTESLREHTGIVLEFQWWMIGGLFTLAALALAYIYNTGRESDRSKFNILFAKIEGIHTKIDDWNKDVLTIENHKYIDHSNLCAICRTAELKRVKE